MAPDTFGNTDSRMMPAHFFFGAVRLDHATAVRADTSKQNYTVCPRHWYIDAQFKCEDCGNLFVWTAVEQRAWFEDHAFFVDSRATRCAACRADRRQLKSLRQEYDRAVTTARQGENLAEKKKIVSLVDQIASMSDELPAKMLETRDVLMKQIRRAEQQA